jgi:hypothetical protein
LSPIHKSFNLNNIPLGWIICSCISRTFLSSNNRAPQLPGRNVSPFTQRVASSLSMTATLEPKVRSNYYSSRFFAHYKRASNLQLVHRIICRPSRSPNHQQSCVPLSIMFGKM